MMFVFFLGMTAGASGLWYLLGMKTSGKGWMGKQLFLLQAQLDRRREQR